MPIGRHASCFSAGVTPSADPPEAISALTDADIHARLFDAMLDHRLVPGMRLREDELGQAFGVSRTRIRQVLIRLATEQLVCLVPNAGARVAEPTPADAAEVFDARRLIEPALLESFITRAGTAELRALQRWITAEERARKSGERRTAIRCAGAFHLHLAEHAGNRTLARQLRELVTRTSLILMRWGPQEIRDPARGVGGAWACDCHEHRGIFAAVKLRDARAAGAFMQQHLTRLQSQLRFESAAPATPRVADLLGLPG